jgi:hypothetical protein
LVSAKRDSHGSGGIPGGRTPRISNGVMLTHAAPSNVCTFSPSASNGCTTATGYLQCRNDINRHWWIMEAEATTGAAGARTARPQAQLSGLPPVTPRTSPLT